MRCERLVAAMTAIPMLWPAPIPAEAPCEDAARVIERFDRTYDETIREAGVSDTGDLIVVLAPPDGSTWTMIRITPEGAACVVAAGTDWRGQ